MLETGEAHKCLNSFASTPLCPPLNCCPASQVTAVLVVPQQSATITTASGRKFQVDAGGISEVGPLTSSAGRRLQDSYLGIEYSGSFSNWCQAVWNGCMYDTRQPFCDNPSVISQYEQSCINTGWGN